MRTKGVNLNSILLFIILGVGGWVGTETRSSALAVVEMRITLKRVEDQMANLVPRREFDLRILAIESRTAELAVKVNDLIMQSKGRR